MVQLVKVKEDALTSMPYETNNVLFAGNDVGWRRIRHRWRECYSENVTAYTNRACKTLHPKVASRVFEPAPGAPRESIVTYPRLHRVTDFCRLHPTFLFFKTNNADTR